MMDQQHRDLQQEEIKEIAHCFSAEPSPGAPLVFPPMTLEMLASLLDFSPDALLAVDSIGTIVLLNTQIEEIFGYGQEELVCQPVETLLPDRLRAGHAAQRLNFMKAPHARPMGVGLKLVGRRKDGSEFPVDISLRPIQIRHQLYVLAAIRDMTAQRSAERERLELTERLHRQDQLINLSHDAIVVHDTEGQITSWNHGAEDLYGWQEHEAIGQVTSSLLSTRFPQPLENILCSLEQEGHWDGELLHVCRDGREVIVESRWALIRNEEGKPTAILEINRDITERRRLERIEQEARKEADALKDQFISLAAHELRTPVTVLAGYADLLLRQAAKGKGQELDEAQKSKILAIQEAADHLTKLTEDLLNVTRVQLGQFQLHQCPTDVVELTRRVIDQIQATTEHHHLTLRTPFAHLQVTVDAFRIEQVLSNLLTNAIKYSPQGGPVEVEIRKEEKQDEVHFQVRDHGMGIPKEQQPRIFGRFVRADNGRNAHITGTGLGLYLCRELVERHGGHIWFESEEQLGSTFFFNLPCGISEQDKVAQ